MKRFFYSIMLAFCAVSFAQEIDLELFATGLNSPVDIKNVGDDRLFVAEQNGRIEVVNSDGSVNTTAFLNISNLLSTGGERGLLGLAFSPNYADNGQFYINYTNTSGNTVIARYTVSEDPNVANPQGEILLTISQPYSNHNGGPLEFDSEGYLWISMGDGGSGGDPDNNAQNLNTYLGKMLRLNVNTIEQTIVLEEDNFSGSENPQIWSYGLRNAWKFSFDRETNEVWIADVGQNAIEEINVQSAADYGLNYGWRCYEGNNVYNNSGCPSPDTMVFPVATYNHSNGRCSLTGGYVYRGSEYPSLVGKYFFADYCSNEIGFVEGNTLTFVDSYSGNYFATFGENSNKDLFVAGRASGRIYKIVDRAQMSVNEQNTEVEIKLYPNPVKDNVQFIANKMVDEIHIYNVNGQLMKKVKPESNRGDVSIKEFTPGVYLIQLVMGNQISSYKIIKK